VNEPRMPEGDAIVYCQGAFTSTYGKTAHGLVRFTRRYRVIAVIDASIAGEDAGRVLDGKANGIPIVASLDEAMAYRPSHFVIGLAPDGGRLDTDARRDVLQAVDLGLNIDSGLHQYLTEDSEIAGLAAQRGCLIRDVRKPPPIDQLHFFSGKIEQVDALKIAVLGTDSAIGKRTTAWRLVQGLDNAGIPAELIGTGQTAWLQGAQYGILLDSLVNDFVSGEIEHAVWRAWHETDASVLVIEGQGSLMNPAYPGGFEILAAGRPDVVILQHAPARKYYDGFPGYPIQPLAQQIQIIELLSGKPVVAVTINHEGIREDRVASICREITQDTRRPTVDVLLDGPQTLVKVVRALLSSR